jgi:hypothetical protein
MRRDEELLRKLLLLAEGEEPKPDLSEYSEEQQAYHAAILIDSGLVEGDTVAGIDGRVTGAVMIDLTPQGHDFLDRIRRQGKETLRTGESNLTEMDIFVSHSKHDHDLAKALIELLVVALNIPRTKIRCTSVVGHQLRGGTSIETKLREEINNSNVFLGLITPSSLSSAYVMFEMGARWGIKKSWYLLKARGAEVTDLKGPLPAYHLPDAAVRTDVAQMIEEIGKELGVVPQNFAAFEDKIAAIVKLARQPEQISEGKSERVSTSFDPRDVETVLTGWVGDNLYSLNNLVIKFTKLDSELGLPPGSSALHLQKIAEAAGAILVRRGSATILFESPEPDPGDGTWAGF